jgi:glycine/D-amino acid oxidase-like deaminating enzyme
VTESAEFAIVGGGIIGASIAYHLARLGARNVVVLEREEELGTGSTGKCAGGVRLQFSTMANVEMSRSSIEALKRFHEELGEDVDFKQNGYLFVLTREDHLATFRNNAEKQRALGVPVAVLTPEEARRVVPQMVIDDLVGATFCSEEGIANPHAIVQGYAKGARRLGVRFEKPAEVTAMEVSSRRVVALSARGERWEVGTVVNAAGPWARPVAEMAGIHLPVAPVRRQYFITKPLDWISDRFPLLIDWGTGVYMHKESGGMLVGESDLDEPSSFNQQVDWDFLSRVSEHAVARIPVLEDAEVKTGVAGLYEMSPDHNAILGAVPELDNFYCANGFSGHGMQHAPAVGLGIAELLTAGKATSLDLSAYDITRFTVDATGERAEYNVI